MELTRHHLADDERGATIVEFALVVPILIVALLGVFDLGHNMYTATMLQGAIQKAARDSTVEGTNETTINTKVENVVKKIAPGAVLEFNRTSYSNFSDVGKAEEYDDLNGSLSCDNGEPFDDANGNGTYDDDRGKEDDRGGARDAVVYEVTVTYPRPFPVASMLGQSSDFTLVAKTVLRNQPFSMQAVPSIENCPA